MSERFADQLSFDLGGVIPEKPRPRRHVPAWQIEQGRLKSWQARRRKADSGPPWRVDDAWPLFRASFDKYRAMRRAEREAARCGCLGRLS